VINAKIITELEAREFPYILGMRERSDELCGILPNLQQSMDHIERAVEPRIMRPRQFVHTACLGER
jgi:hypothetical protein